MISPITRRDALKGAGTILMAGVIGPQAASAEVAPEPVTPESVGFAADLPARFAALEDSGRLLNVHGVVALLKGRMMFERYMVGTDEMWGRPLGTVDFKADTLVDDGRRYGYHWYTGELAVSGKTGAYGTRWIGAFGLGGQRLFVFPEREFVLAVTAGNYATEDQWRPPIAILREVFLASLVD